MPTKVCFQSMTNENFDYKKLRTIIENKGLKNTWLAKQVGLSHGYFKQVVAGSETPSMRSIMLLSHTLECRVEDLMKDLDETSVS